MFRTAPTTTLGDRSLFDRLDESDARLLVERAINETIATEAPILASRLVKVVTLRFGIDRVSRARADAILAIAADMVLTSGVEPDRFLWNPDEPPDRWSSYRRTPQGADRKLDHIPAVEIANAMLDITAMGLAIEAEQLHRELVALFDLGKLTAAIRERFDASTAALLADGRLVARDGRLRVG